MNKETDEKVESTSSEDNIIEFGGKSFDVSTSEGKLQLKTWAEAFTSAYGKMGQEVGGLRDEVKPIRRFGVKKVTPDKLAIMKEVGKMQEDGDSDAAMRRMFEYVEQVQAKSEYEREKDRFWADYVQTRSELFEDLPEDMAKNYIFSQYEDSILETEDPYGLIDRVLKPKIKKALDRVVVPKVIPEETSYVAQSGHSKVTLKAIEPAQDDKKSVSFEDIVKDVIIR